MNLVSFQAYKKACENYIALQIKDTQQNRSAIANSDGTFSFAENSLPYHLYLNWIDEQAVGISDLDIKANYLYQLGEISLPDSKANIEELRLGILSANTTSLHISFNQLRSATEAELATCLESPTKTADLLSNKHLLEYGIHNVVAIKLQNLFAQKLFSTVQLSRLGLKINPQQKPIYVYTAIDKPFISVEGKPLLLSEASKAQKISAAKGELQVQHNVSYKANRLFDISQLLLSDRQQQELLQGEVTACPFEILSEFARKSGINTEYSPMVGTGLNCYFDKAKNSIILDSNIHVDFKMSAYISALSHGLTEKTSSSALPIKQFEEQLLSLHLHTVLGEAPPPKLSTSLSDAFAQAKNERGFNLEKTLAKVSRCTLFVGRGTAKLIATQSIEQQQTKQQTVSQEKSSEILSNFMREL